MKPHFIDPARLKSLIESAEIDLGFSPMLPRVTLLNI